MLNEALRLIRVYHDLNQSEAAQRLGISKSHLSGIEKGVKAPSLDLVERYSREFNLPMSSIMFFAENVNEPRSYEQARTFVASRIVSLLKFLEDRSGRPAIE